MKFAAVPVVLLMILPACGSETEEPVVPSPEQVEYQKMELIGFIHFTVNTFTDKEWGYGDENPDLFNPTQPDPGQWARVAREAGMKQLILTAKHHDGFCLWPSRHTTHDISNSPYKNGRGDIVGEFVDACRQEGLKVGLYLSPWDRNHPDYGGPAYITYYRNQLIELLTNYGDINEIWFDGANGGDGYYGGARTIRHIDRETYYDWDSTIALVRSLQPGIMIFSDAGPDIRWVGNENGFAGETFWSTIQSGRLVIGASDPDYLNRGDPDGDSWLIGQCDVSIRPGWFYHPDEDSLVKTPEELVDIYYRSVGRNGLLLLNLPPDRRGLIHENDVASLMEFREILDETFGEDLATGASKTRHEKNGIVELTYELKNAAAFDRILLQEDIRKGQRVSRFRVEAGSSSGKWQEIAAGTTIGYKRLLRIDPQRASRLRLVIEESNHPPLVARLGLYSASEREPDPAAFQVNKGH